MLRGRQGALTETEESAEGGVPCAAIVPRCAATRTLGRCRSAAGTAVGPGVGGSQSPGPPPGGGEQMASRPDTPTCKCMTIFGKPCARSLNAAMMSSVHCALVSVVLELKYARPFSGSRCSEITCTNRLRAMPAPIDREYTVDQWLDAHSVGREGLADGVRGRVDRQRHLVQHRLHPRD